MRKLPEFIAAVLVLMLTGCGVGEGTGSTPPWAEAETPVAPVPTSAPDENPPPEIDPFRVRLQTTQGDVVIAVHPEWAPRGAARFKELVESGFYDDNRIFRVVPGFVVQFGMHGDPEMSQTWREKRIADDPVTQSNKRGYVTFATSGPNSRTTQIFINLGDNVSLDSMPQSFAPFGEVVEGMDVVESFNAQYGEAPSGEQMRISMGGNAFLDAEFPGLDSVVKATIVDGGPEAASGEAQTSEGTTPPAESAQADQVPAPAEETEAP